MIPTILIIVGAVLILISLFWTINYLWHEFIRPGLIVIYRQDDYIKYETEEGQRSLRINRKKFFNRLGATFSIGLILIAAGYYLGYAEKGEAFWGYRMFYGSPAQEAGWDRLTGDGKFISEDGAEYAYYILIEKTDIRVNDQMFRAPETVEELAALETQLRSIPRGSSVILVDNYAASSTYRTVTKLLQEIGLQFEEERL